MAVELTRSGLFYYGSHIYLYKIITLALFDYISLQLGMPLIWPNLNELVAKEDSDCLMSLLELSEEIDMIEEIYERSIEWFDCYHFPEEGDEESDEEITKFFHELRYEDGFSPQDYYEACVGIMSIPILSSNKIESKEEKLIREGIMLGLENAYYLPSLNGEYVAIFQYDEGSPTPSFDYTNFLGLIFLNNLYSYFSERGK